MLVVAAATAAATVRRRTAVPPAPVDPTTIAEADLLSASGDFGGIRVPEIAPQCPEDPVTHVRCTSDRHAPARGLAAGTLFTPAYVTYTPAQRAAARAAYQRRGYRLFPISVYPYTARWYHGIFPPADHSEINARLQELWDDGLVPLCFVIPDDGHTLQPTTPGLDRRLCRRVVPMWEMDAPLNGDTSRINTAILNTVAAFPAAIVTVHFTAKRYAGGEPAADWWRWAVAHGVRGIEYQDTGDNATDVRARVADLVVRLGGGYHGWPRTMPDGKPVVVDLFETDIYPKFWSGRAETESIAYNNRILALMTAPACIRERGTLYCGTLTAFGSGGTVR